MDERMRVSMEVERLLREGDVEAVRSVLGDPPEWPNVLDPYMAVPVLSLGLAFAPLPAIRRLLAEGADPNFRVADDGFPALIDVVHHRRSRPEITPAADAHDLLAALIEAGARVDERGLNDWTALHFAASYDDHVAVRLLLEAGADPHSRTRIDDFETPLDVAENLQGRSLALLKDWIDRS